MIDRRRPRSERARSDRRRICLGTCDRPTGTQGELSRRRPDAGRIHRRGLLAENYPPRGYAAREDAPPTAGAQAGARQGAARQGRAKERRQEISSGRSQRRQGSRAMRPPALRTRTTDAVRSRRSRVDELKAHLRLDGLTADATIRTRLLGLYIAAAVEHIETKATGSHFARKSWTAKIDWGLAVAAGVSPSCGRCGTWLDKRR
jgi:hypothetical protein